MTDATPPAPLKTLLLLAHNFPPQVTSGAQRPARFARYLPRFGYQAQVVASPFEGEDRQSHVTRVPNGAAPLGVRLASQWSGVVERLVSPYNERMPWVPFAVHAGAHVARRQGAVALLSTAPPPATHETGLRLKRRLGLPWVADFRDPLLGNPFRAAPRAQRYYERLEAAVLREADAILANTEAFAELLRHRYPDRAAKIVTLPNGYDPENACEALPSPARNHRVLAHVGTLYRGRHPGRLLASLDRLVRRGVVDPSRLRVELTGPVQDITEPLDGPVGERLRSLGCLWYDGQKVSPADARRRTAEADYLLLLDLNEGEEGSIQVPAKLFDYVQVGRPILAFTQSGSPTDAILARSGVPHASIDPGDSDETTDRQIESLLQMPTEPAKPSAWFTETFDGIAQTRLLAGLLDRLCSGASLPG